jgi:hypothetical protein
LEYLPECASARGHDEDGYSGVPGKVVESPLSAAERAVAVYPRKWDGFLLKIPLNKAQRVGPAREDYTVKRVKCQHHRYGTRKE